ncbi:hypothetical protein M2459_003322 [Parabacteroides sp. PF5-5]|nr:hypothetical protein [Parabacteroides sp. PH5-39]MDH6317564.1 hypothetical protein [Parabacteroides sp. PF5-13]MDH6321308.1 hypothetical protein [Parabacteroides sp. PH5-13]MDH6325040.1 hypothetical protein [Parabacteroides sp. PH5-8]MDH6328749.1 hypothetical protein [Parabacteroides sp. PH5-41]MDH6336551.1 hypothetical protein [Parabacteroides sp. PF5-5]MDH6347615.1 hypothetical protein [Parabacteroides sp. PH5-46]MDH6362527.1 hypothetical protein [Parabacteroides sp. PH5-16]MDH6378245.
MLKHLISFHISSKSKFDLTPLLFKSDKNIKNKTFINQIDIRFNIYLVK